MLGKNSAEGGYIPAGQLYEESNPEVGWAVYDAEPCHIPRRLHSRQSTPKTGRVEPVCLGLLCYTKLLRGGASLLEVCVGAVGPDKIHEVGVNDAGISEPDVCICEVGVRAGVE